MKQKNLEKDLEDGINVTDVTMVGTLEPIQPTAIQKTLPLSDGTEAYLEGVFTYNSENATMVGKVLLGDEKYAIGINIKDTKDITEKDKGYIICGEYAMRVNTNAPNVKELEKALGAP
ncbi:MAG: hypothetical protein JSW73_00980 [Candidatus Woesearchaeota archaeon]|nr:MAG: hypothetical protein JSW73_00980 [Candidatus Woesearchaeota archaeon]